RAYGRGAFMLRRLFRSSLTAPRLHALLLAALYRLDSRSEDTHTTVDQAATAAATLAHGRFRNLVNAVLRNAIRQRHELRTELAEDEVAQWQHPQWWITAVREAYPECSQEVLSAANHHPPMTLR